MLGGSQKLVIPAIGDPTPLTSMDTPTYEHIPLPITCTHIHMIENKYFKTLFALSKNNKVCILFYYLI